MLQSVTNCYKVLQSVTNCYKVLKIVTKCYKLLQSVTNCYKVLQKVTRKYCLAPNTEINLEYLYWAEPKKLFSGVLFNIQASNRVYGPVLNHKKHVTFCNIL